MEEVHSFGNIKLGGKITGAEGIVKVNNHGIGWKNKAGVSETFDGTTLASASWIRIMRALFQLELKFKNGTIIKFDGFREQDLDLLKSHFKKHFSVDLQVVELSTKGWNWGDTDFQGNSLYFTVDGKRAFEIPLNDVARSAMQTTVGARNDVSLEFHQDDLADDNESLVEIRFHFPPGDKQDKSQASAFLEHVLSKADTVSTVGKGIVVFEDLSVLTPRGKYAIEMHPSFLRLHGKTFDYKIQYRHITRLFQLPRPDQRHIYFVISLDPPIKQGQTRYPHVVLTFNKEDTIEVPVNITKETAEKYKDLAGEGGKLKGRTYDLVCKAFKTLSSKKITIPNNFKSAGESTAIKCSLKANEGYLYPLERSFFFVHKPPTHVRFDEISGIEFARVSSSQSSSSNRTFDVVITMKNNSAFQFTGIQRAEYTNLFNFISSKKLPIKVGQAMETEESESVLRETMAAAAAEDDDSEEEDEDFVAQEEDDVPEEYDSPDDEDEDDDFGEGDEDEGEASPKKAEKSGESSKKRRSSDNSEKKEKKEKKHKKEKKDTKEKKHKKDKKDKKDKKEKQSKSGKEEE